MKKQNDILTEHLGERETELDEVLQKLADAQSPTECSKNKPLLTQIEKLIENRFNNVQSNLLNMIDEKLSSNLNAGKQSTYASTTAAEENNIDSIQKQTRHNVQNFRSRMMSTRNEELAEQKKIRKSELAT